MIARVDIAGTPPMDHHALANAIDDPWVRHQVNSTSIHIAWVRGRAAVIAGPVRPNQGTGTLFTCIGPPEDLTPLLNDVAAAAPAPERLSVEEHSSHSLPWPISGAHAWHWMLCGSPPPVATGADAITEVDDQTEINAVLDEGNEDSYARPGDPDVDVWLGTRVDGELAAVGAITRPGDGTGHLRAVTTSPRHRRQGLGRKLSAELTRRALIPTGVATLSVYVDNDAAVTLYRRLGYRVVHTFVSGTTFI